jgi:hypothetical protein
LGSRRFTTFPAEALPPHADFEIAERQIADRRTNALQGCQIFVDKTYQNGGKMPNDSTQSARLL